MRALPGPLATTAQGVATTLLMLVDIVCLNGTAFYFTSGDRDFVYEGQTYVARPGCNLSQVQTVLGTSTESCSITTLIDPAGVTSAVIESGAMDNATMRVLIADFTSQAAVVFFEGFVSQVTYEDKITALIQGNPYLGLDVTIASDVYSSNCRADLGDSRCRFDITTLQKDHTVTAITSQQEFSYDVGNVVDHYWRAGCVTFTSGANKGFAIEIQDSLATGDITLKGILPYPVVIGDTITLYPGCDKTTTMCQQRYANILNFQGEPFSVAPWVTTESGDTTGTTVPSTGLFLYGTAPVGAGLGPFNGPECVPPQGRMPQWGPYADQWNFSGAGATSAGAASGPGSTVASFKAAFYVSTKLTAGQYVGLGPPNNQGGNDVIIANIGFSSEQELTPDQAAIVKLAYPDAPYDG